MVSVIIITDCAHYEMANCLHNTQPLVHLLGWGIGCHLWLHSLIYVSSCHCCTLWIIMWRKKNHWVFRYDASFMKKYGKLILSCKIIQLMYKENVIELCFWFWPDISIALLCLVLAGSTVAMLSNLGHAISPLYMGCGELRLTREVFCLWVFVEYNG